MCLSCDIIKGKVQPPGGIILQNDLVLLHHCVDVNIPGYLILSPVRHIISFDELTDSEINALGQLAKKLVGILKKRLTAEKIYVCSFGEETHHLHIHIFPRLTGRGDVVDEHEGLVDGALYFSRARSKYKVTNHEMISSSRIREVTNFVRNEVKKLGY